MANIIRIMAFAAIFSAQVARAKDSPIQVLYPYEGQRIAAVEQTFIFGNVIPSTGTLRINDADVKVHSNGAFLAYLPVAKGDFAFTLEYRYAKGQPPVIYKRNVTVGQAPKPPLSTEKPELDRDSLLPSTTVEYLAGDCFQIAAQGSPGMNADFSIENVLKHAEMTELPANSGRYTGLYCIKPEDKAERSEITVRLSKGWSHDAAQAQGRLSILPPVPAVAEITADLAGLRSDYDGGYYMFASSGTRLHITGRIGSRLRAELGPCRSAWVDDSKVKLLPLGTPLPKAILGTISTDKAEHSSKVRIEMTAQAPYTARLEDDALLLNFYYTRNFTNWIVYDSSDTMVKDISWQQTDNQTCGVKITLNHDKKLWGYDISYANGGYNIELRDQPVFACKGKAPLQGLTIVLDPGHSPKKLPALDGALGPSGSFEYAVNYLIAKELEPLLREKGANVVLTRNTETEDVPLQARPGIAWAARGDLFLSIHNNALPDGENPLSPGRGFSVYYYHPQSMDFARHMRSAFARRIPLPDEQLRLGDYLVIRQTQMPAILTECAYQIIPEQELLLNTPAFRKKLAAAMLEGMLSYMKSVAPQGCKITLASPAPTASKKKPAAKQDAPSDKKKPLGAEKTQKPAR